MGKFYGKYCYTSIILKNKYLTSVASLEHRKKDSIEKNLIKNIDSLPYRLTSAEALHNTWGENNQNGARVRARAYPIFFNGIFFTWFKEYKAVKITKKTNNR